MNRLAVIILPLKKGGEQSEVKALLIETDLLDDKMCFYKNAPVFPILSGISPLLKLIL